MNIYKVFHQPPLKTREKPGRPRNIFTKQKERFHSIIVKDF